MKRINTKRRIVNLKKTKNHPNTSEGRRFFKGKNDTKTHPQPSIPSNRQPFSNWYGYPSSCNNKFEKGFL